MTAVKLPNPSKSVVLAEPGANLHRVYHLAMHLSALYGHAADLDHRAGTKEFWKHAALNIVADIGSVYRIWDSHRAEAGYLLPILEDPAFTDRLNHLSRRFRRLINVLSTWVILPRWVRPLTRLEWRWTQALDEISRLDPTLASQVESLQEQCRKRVAILEELAHLYKSGNEELQRNYAVPKALAES
jgi:hypothetical protein